MTPRDHHFFFAKKLIPSQTFQSPERMFDELRSPQREAFLFFLWNEAGKASGQPLPHVDVVRGPQGPTMAKLDVVGALRRGDAEVIVISMPPALNPNEALFLALVRRPGEVSVFTYERCRDDAGTAVSQTDAVLAELRADGSRVNHGFKTGLDLAAFTAHLGELLGVSLDGLDGSLPPVTVADFVARGGGPGRAGDAGRGTPRGSLLESLLLVRGLLPTAGWLLGVLGLMGALWPVLHYGRLALSLTIGVLLLVWLHGVYSDRRGQMPFSPGMAVGGWLIPFANFVLPALIVRGAWKAYVGPGAGIVTAWWLIYLVDVILASLQGAGVHIVHDLDRDVWFMALPTTTLDLPTGLGALLGPLWSYGSMLFATAAYLLLWHIVRRVRAG